jgi:SHS2 domain-containing protein
MADVTSSTGGYEFFEHTADVGVRAWGGSLTELFEQAAAGFINAMFDPCTIRRRRVRQVTAAGQSPEELLVAWLEEILFAFDAERFAPAAASVASIEGGEVRGELWGEDFDPSRHRVRQAVKAVTYSDLRIEKRGDLYEVRIVFDV